MSVTWVFFRAQGLDASLRLLHTMTHLEASQMLEPLQVATVASVLGVTLVFQALLRNADLEEQFARLPLWLRGPILALPILCLFLAPGDDRAFIYFQF